MNNHEALSNLYIDNTIIRQLCVQFAGDIPAESDEMLYEISAKYIKNDMWVLDVGCRDAKKTRKLRRQTEATVIAMDLLFNQLHNDCSDPMFMLQADARWLPYANNVFDAVWCIDMLSHIEDINMCFAEFDRVLKPGGVLIIYSMECAADKELPEQAYLMNHLALAPSFADRQRIPHAAQHWFELRERIEIGGQWREVWEMAGERVVSQQLVRISRLNRFRNQLIDAVGEARYHAEYARCMANVWHLMGYFSPVMWVYRKHRH
jgi:ubiquinone/menaquinone biosynthesis C-methylase UbiE